MFISYLKITLRNLFKKKVFSAINIIGLALGMAACISIFYYVGYEFSYDEGFADSESIYRVYLKRTQENRTRGYFYLPGPFREGLSKRSEIDASFRIINIDYQNNSVIYKSESGKNIFEQSNINYADKEIAKTLGLEALYGSFEKMNEPFKVIIANKVANKIFDNSMSAIGKIITVSGNIGAHEYEVVGVMPDLPKNTHFNFEILLSMESIKTVESDLSLQSWDGWNCRTYIKSNRSLSGIQDAISSVLSNTPFVKEEGSSWKSFSWPIEEMHLATVADDGTIDRSKQDLLFGLIGLGVFILILAWTNFINLSTARALERSREVGVRKVLGSHKYQIRVQFILESLFINLIALILAFTVVQVSIPFLSEISNPMSLTHDQTMIFWVSIVSIIVVGSLLSGLYPAFILSEFKPVLVLKGQLSSTGTSNGKLRKILVTFQFVASTVMIIGTFIIYEQITYMKNQALGMNVDNMLLIDSPPRMVNSPGNNSSEVFLNKVKELSTVQNVTGSSYTPGKPIGWNTVFKEVNQSNEQLKNLYLIASDENFNDAYGLKLLAGRFFNRNDNTFGGGSIIINEQAVDYLGFKSAQEALGQKLTDNNMFAEVTIIGVVKNFHQQSLQYTIDPCAFIKSSWFNYFSVSLNMDQSISSQDRIKQLNNTIAQIKEQWHEVFPDTPFDYTFLDQRFDSQYRADQQFGTIILLFAVISICIAVLGLFGLSAYAVSRRTKEIGIRKVLGASISKLFLLISMEYLRLILIAIVVAIPISIWLMNKWLIDYYYRIDIQWYMIAVPIFLIFTAAITIICTQVLKAAQNNPIESLKCD